MKEWLRRLFGRAPEPAEWALGTGQEAGHPLVVRTRTRAPKGVIPANYPASVEIVWRYDGDARDGMPTLELAAQMDECDEMLHKLEGPANGILAVAITGNNRREWIWYVSNPEVFATRVNAVQEIAGRRFPIEVRPSTRTGASS
jgi:hypothetical protein